MWNEYWLSSILCFLLLLTGIAAVVAIVRLNKRAQKYKKALDVPGNFARFKALRRKVRWHYLAFYLPAVISIFLLADWAFTPGDILLLLPSVLITAALRWGLVWFVSECMLWIPRKDREKLKQAELAAHTDKSGQPAADPPPDTESE